MIAARVALCVSLLLGSCGEPAPISPARVEHSLGPMDALARRFGRLRRRMFDRGYGRAEQLQRTFSLEGQGVALPVDLVTGACTTWIALAGGGLRDLEASVYDGDGIELAIDSVRGEGALVHVCPPEGEVTAPHYLELRAREGSGAIVLGAFVSTPGEGEGFDALFDGIVSRPVPFREVEEALAEVRDSMRERGLDAEGEPRFRRIAEGQGVRQPVSFRSDRCYVVVARGGEGVDDVDLYLYDGRGAEVARDLGHDARPRIEHCPQRDGTGSLELRAFEGSGAIGIMTFSGPPPEDELPEPDTVEEAAPLAVLGTQIEELVERGFVDPLYLVQDGSLSPGETRTHEVVVGPGCEMIVGAGGPGELDLDLYLVDAVGNPVDRDTRVQRTARVAVCSSQQAAYRVTVKAYGRGRYALARLRAPGSSDIAALRVATLSPPDLDSPNVRRLVLDEGERARIPVDACVVALVGGQETVEDVDLQLTSATGELLASDTGPAPWARVEHCPDPGVPGLLARLEVVVYRGRGEVMVQWHAP